MDSSRRSPSSITICLCIQISACLLGLTVSSSPSLWGKKVVFSARPCVWQLKPEVVVPALEELSVCMLLRRNLQTEWTGFVYKAPGGSHIELGLGGSSAELVAWLFGVKWHLKKELQLNEWHSVCLTWSGRAQRLRLYINGTSHLEAPVNSTLPQRLGQNGTLTLGVSHNVDVDGKLQTETGKNLLGDIGLFRIWARERSAEELGSCADGDVVSWDLRQWDYGCSPEPDNILQCAWSLYKIKMQAFIARFTKPVKLTASLEEITRNWLESIFPDLWSVRYIFVSSPSQTCHVGNNSAALHTEHAQGSRALMNFFDKCFSCEVYVNVTPATDVDKVQSYITEKLSLIFSYNLLNLTADPNRLSIQPVGYLPIVTKPLPTISIDSTTSGSGPTHSLPTRPSNMSTTRKPQHITDTAKVNPDVFFRVNVTLSMTGTPRKPKDIIEKWLREKLEVNSTMVVLNLKIMDDSRNVEQCYGLMISHGRYKEYECTFHVQESTSLSVSESQQFINDSLTSKNENDTVVIQTIVTVIKHIVPDNCPEDTMQTIYGLFTWPEAFPQESQMMGCRAPLSGRAVRLCKLDSDSDTVTRWADPDMTACKPLLDISDLDKINVTTDNAAEIVDMIRDLINVEFGSTGTSEGELSASHLDTVVEKLEKVVDICTVTPALGTDIVNIIADILISKSDITPLANIVLNLTERIGDNMDFQGESVSITAPSLAFSMINVDPGEFSGLTFGVSSFSSGLDPKIFINRSFVSDSFPDTVATISLPSALHGFFSPRARNRTRVQFQFYGIQDLFKDPDINTGIPQSNWTLNTYIVSASINNSHVINLKERVVVTLSHHTPTQQNDKLQCVFWDFQKNGGQGGWNSSGCDTQRNSPYQTSCLCDHLTHFAVLLDVTRTPLSDTDSRILTVISYLGCGLSSIFLGVTLLTYMAFEKLRRDYPSKILINLSVALLGLNMLFLLDSWLSSFPSYGLCIVTAATLHYFMLASFTWMGLEAVHMYFALVKVFNVYVPSYILKFCAVGWGVPLVIVSLVLAIDKDAYGNAVSEDAAVPLQANEPFCWLQNDIFFYVTVVAFVLLILLCNISIFIVVLIQIRQMRTNKPSGKSHGSLHDLRAVASLTVLLGLTWSIAFFAWGPGRVVLLYLFSILNTLQGFFVFVFHCLMKENVRKQWRVHLCCGRFRLSDNTDWSRSVTLGGRCKQNQLVHSAFIGSVDTSSIRKVSDSSTESGPSHHQRE